jgi:hypothetical protein
VSRDNDRVRPDYSARISLEGSDDSILVSPRYDRVDIFAWISHSIMRVIVEEGVAHIHVSEETGRRVAKVTGIPLVECEFITETDYEKYLEVQERDLEQLFEL